MNNTRIIAVKHNSPATDKKSARRKKHSFFDRFLKISRAFVFLFFALFIAGTCSAALRSGINGIAVSSLATVADSGSDKQITTALPETITTAQDDTTEKRTAVTSPQTTANKAQTTAAEIQTTAAEPPTVYSGDISWIPPEGLMAPPGYTGKIAYLTFDDGPSQSRTPKILDILSEYRINATFFLVGQYIRPSNYAIIRRAFEEGNVIGNHTYDHFAAGSSPEHFKFSVNKTSDMIEEITGKRPECFRFPGGSNSGYMKGVIQAAVPWLHENGYEYFDWSTSTGDGNGRVTYSAQQLCDNALKDSRAKHLIVLMHDSSVNSNHPHDAVGATPLIIRALYNRGYKFGVLTRNSIAVQFH